MEFLDGQIAKKELSGGVRPSVRARYASYHDWRHARWLGFVSTGL